MELGGAGVELFGCWPVVDKKGSKYSDNVSSDISDTGDTEGCKNRYEYEILSDILAFPWVPYKF